MNRGNWLSAAALAAVLTGTAPLQSLGQLLVEYRSSLADTPHRQGWQYEAGCLSTSCPGALGGLPCLYQGAADYNSDTVPDNNCLPGVGCHRYWEHYNAPEPNATGDACTFTEWLAFDNGDNTSWRPLTIPDSYVPNSPPWGAPGFLNAPPYPTLRIVTGDGNAVADSLPFISGNNRNLGRLRMRKEFTPSGSAITLLCRVACGPRSVQRPFVDLRAFGHRLSFSVDGDAGSVNHGRLAYGSGGSETGGTSLGVLFPGTDVQISHPAAGTPTIGEFFSLRAVLRSDGTATTWLNDWAATQTELEVQSAPAGFEILLTPDKGDDTLWLDFLEVHDGPWPPACADPVFDVDDDGSVNWNDFNAPAGFAACVTGPGAGPEAWASRPLECHCQDADQDNDVDMADFGVFQQCLSLGGAQANAACDDPPAPAGGPLAGGCEAE